MNRAGMLLLLVSLAPTDAWAKKVKPVPPPVVTMDLGTRWVRASDEYVGMARQAYGVARDEILADAARLPAGSDWVVISDLDETLIDNSLYQVERFHVGGWDEASWAAWETRREAVPMPGAKALVDAIHAAGGRFAYITNRKDAPAALDVLKKEGLWGADDHLCVRVDVSDKAPRRQSVRDGTPGCGWEGKPMKVLGYLGDQMGDFPAAGEDVDPLGRDPWGDRWFLLSNPMYGGWQKREARP